MRKPVSRRESESDVRGGVFDLDSLLPRRAPTLYQFLTDDKWDDGSQREPGTLLLFADAGRFKACLNDRDSGRSVFVSAVSLEGILEALEEGLAGDSLEWREKKGPAGKGRR